ncbi:MAG: phage integrase N-terminal SAM-like domain-containing protein [Anaerolineae bacterium]|nr:phage integrase N-terminal SAM-like domain-containing protein [Anaerolineae bacterium]MCO5191406.1 phage integrase N-terminal SAM-like domain-containing protein [Anaerolineae bacterium]MCO5193723.1 phage integrase N-terminal SAM-like domain-containing protein [Anaerolineae bacterium]MCO5196712.1 phage integrase N-terminal SAM-like domain-containing protein [Anaerolineae bacterium]MCO5206818.1 phage integrase N-terminal SAM-like domain-containing protein [Anaerolineae bacterium]
MNSRQQSPLFPESSLPPEKDSLQRLVSADTSLKAAIGVFEQHMRQEGFSIHTIKAFTSDLRLLGKFLGIGQPVGNIGSKELNDFLFWLKNERGVPCSPKSYARRVTTLKVFFEWLNQGDVLTHNPATAVIQESVTSPLPNLPTDSEIEQALAVSTAWLTGENRRKPDARPHLLLTLLLKTGIKKGEAMTIHPNHIDRGDEDNEPTLFIRYKSPRMRYKERKVPLDASWLETLDLYLEQYAPPDTLFTCTARNLEYILRDIGDEAELERGKLSFENVRWASALRDYRANVDPDQIRQRLGLSKVTWRETKNKLDKLVAKLYPT